MRRVAIPLWILAACLGTGALLWVVGPLAADGSTREVPLDSLHGSAKLEAVMDRVVMRQRALRSMRAEFVQVRSSELLLGDVRSTGEFCYLAPDRVRWDYRKPDAMVVLFADDWVTTFHPAGKRAERVKVSSGDRRFVQALAGTLPLDDLLTYFRIRFEERTAPQPYVFVLEPTAASLRRRLRSLSLEVDRSLLLPVVVDFHEADGDATRYEFHGIQIDPHLDVSRFLLEFSDSISVETIDASSGLG
ncbi:MAG TPA: outer membrane lipoprotein carrier protein LolA [Thermoanaerobaculales bacterium]|nr:outer membrane lipoprotein carrier protein LolA [Thermoanaerobaculales bacterium]HQL30079.1 outer membrane lipoprotein carrier protein LolA [Thermoanaerobaculales bacterium]